MLLLRPDQRTKLDESNDELFYQQPRFVTHVDDAFIRTLTALYRQHLQSGTRILDLMSSWVSHLPEEMQFEHVEGHGLNAAELARNPRLDHCLVQNLNQDPKLPFPDQSFDAVLNAVSVQYLQYPEAVLSEVHRILKPGGVVIISFSNRMFYQKAIQAWRDASEGDRVALVKNHLDAVPGFLPAQVVSTAASGLPSWFSLFSSDSFYAVLSQKEC